MSAIASHPSHASHPIHLLQLMFTRVQVIAVPGHQPTSDVVDCAPMNSIQVDRLPDQPGRYQAVMRTQVNPEGKQDYPYQVDIESIAILSADTSLTPQDADKGVLMTAHSVLFGAIRETVTWLTARQPYGPLLLGLSVLRPQEAEPQSSE